MVLDKIKTDDLLPTIKAVRKKLDQPLPLGESNAGVVAEVGPGVEGFKMGDRVVSNGKHAEMVAVPKNICARIPNGVSDEAATFTGSFASALGDSITITLSARSDPFEGIRDSIDFQWSEFQRVLMISVRWTAGGVHINAMSGIDPRMLG